MVTKLLLLGNSGQLGWELNRTLISLGELTAVDYPEIDLGNPNSVQEIVDATEPDIVINAGAFTDVDLAEKKADLAFAVNSEGPGLLAELLKKRGGLLIHFSTDYVFNGKSGTPYVETDSPSPLNIYGQSKLGGESSIRNNDGNYLIFRTSWVYSLRRRCFLTNVVKWAEETNTLRIVDDQTSTPTSSRYLAEVIAQIIAQGRDHPVEWLSERKGLYHLTNSGSCNRYEWAKKILSIYQNKKDFATSQILPAKSSEFSSAAERPAYTTLDCSKTRNTFHLTPASWEISLELMLMK